MSDEQLPDGVPSMDIPDLKKKEKERKKAGAALGKGGQAGEAFQGARGGAGLGGGGAGGAGGVARAAASAAARGLGQAGLEAGGSLFGRIAAMVARFLATAIGKAVAAAVVAAMLAGVAAVARMAGNGGADAAAGAPSLGDISSSIRVRRDGDASGLAMARNNGLVQFDKPKAAAPPDAGKAPDAAGAPDKGAVAGDAAGAGPGGLDNGAMMAAQRDRMAHNMSMSKLSSSLGGGGSFGGKDIFANGPKLGRGFNAGKLAANSRPPANKGQTSTRAKVASRAAQRRGAFRGSRALGRLMQMATLNRGMTAGTATSEGSSTMASDQFEGQQTAGGAAPGGAPTSTDSGGTGGGDSGGGGYGGTGNENPTDACTQIGQMSDGHGGCSDPNVGEGIDGSPWRALIATVESMIDAAKTLLYVASGLYMLSLALLCCPPIAAAIAAIAGLLCSIIVTVLAMIIKNMGDQIKGMGQEAMGNTVNDIGNDLIAGAWTAILAGVGGIIFAGKVDEKKATLQGQMAEAMAGNAQRAAEEAAARAGATGGTGGTTGGGP